MANAVNYLAQIQTGQTIQAVHVNQFVDALSGSAAYDLVTSGSYTIIGPLYATASWATNALNAKTADSASKPYIASNASTNTEYTLVFKNSTGVLNDYYQLAADGTNGPYYNPSTNTLTVPVISGSSARITSITGSVLGDINGSSSYATTASYALTSSYASNGVTNLSVGTFYDTTTQTVTTGASASITLNTPVISDWLRKNGTNVTYSNTGISIQNQNQKYVGAWNFVESLNPGDYLELVWYVSGGASAQLVAETAAPTNGGVGVPSVIVTMTQIK